MSHKKSVFRRLNKIWGLDIPLDSKIYYHRNSWARQIALASWFIDDENNKWKNLCSDYTLTELATTYKNTPLLIVKDEKVLQIVPSNDSIDWLRRNKENIYNPHGKDLEWIWSKI